MTSFLPISYTQLSYWLTFILLANIAQTLVGITYITMPFDTYWLSSIVLAILASICFYKGYKIN